MICRTHCTLTDKSQRNIPPLTDPGSILPPAAVWWQQRVNKTYLDYSLWTQLKKSFLPSSPPVLITSSFQFKGAVIFYHYHLTDVFPEKLAGCDISCERGGAVELRRDLSWAVNAAFKLSVKVTKLMIRQSVESVWVQMSQMHLNKKRL